MTEIKVFEGITELNLDSAFHAEKIIMSDNSKIITNGNELRIVCDILEVRGEAKITSFIEGASDFGEHGKDAGNVYLIAKNLLGEVLAISNVGQDGADGADGADGEKGKKVKR